MKKFIAMLACLLLVMGLMTVAFAADSVQMTVTAEKNAVRRGEIVEFSVAIGQLENCKSGSILLDGFYDTAVFEFVDGTCTVPNATLANVGVVGNYLTGSFALSNAATVSGEIFTIRMRVKNDAPLGETNFSVAGVLRDANGEVDVTVKGTVVDIVIHQMSITADKTAVKRGDVVEFVVAMDELVDCTAAGVVLDYDQDAFEFVKGECTLTDPALQNFGLVGGYISGSFALRNATTVSGEIFRFQLRVKDTAAFGDTVIGVHPSVRTSAGAVDTMINSVEMQIAEVFFYAEPAVTEAARGDIVEYTISVDEIEDCRAAAIVLYFDDEQFEMVDGKCTVSGASLSNFGVVNNLYSGSFAFPSATNLSGETFRFRLKALENASCGDIDLEMVTSARNTNGDMATGAVITPFAVHDWTDWQSIDDGTHGRTCTACGAEEVEAHTYGAQWIHDAQYHWHECVCGAKTELGAHEFTEEIVDEAHLVPDSSPAQYYYDCAHCDAMGTETFCLGIPGDVDGSEAVNEDDAIYLLQHILMPGMFPLSIVPDYDHNGVVNEDDAIYLLQHILMPNMFPL